MFGENPVPGVAKRPASPRTQFIVQIEVELFRYKFILDKDSVVVFHFAFHVQPPRRTVESSWFLFARRHKRELFCANSERFRVRSEEEEKHRRGRGVVYSMVFLHHLEREFVSPSAFSVSACVRERSFFDRAAMLRSVGFAAVEGGRGEGTFSPLMKVKTSFGLFFVLCFSVFHFCVAFRPLPHLTPFTAFIG